MEIEYEHGFEHVEKQLRTTAVDKVYLNICGKGIGLGFLICFLSLFGLIINEAVFMSMMMIGVLVVLVSGITYDLHGGYDAEKSGKKLSVSKKEYFDILDTKTGKIKRTFVKGRENE